MNPHPDSILWTAPPAEPALDGREIHVWAASLSVPPDELRRLRELLSASERERAERFRFDQHRNRFTAARGILRSILGQHLRCDPASIEFASSANGKPEIAPPLNAPHFNLSHSEDLALIAVTLAGPIGVDVEAVRRVKDVDDLVERFFSARESRLFHEVPDVAKAGAFFNLWTRKEALLKATGEGITASLNLVEVSFLADEPAAVLAVADDTEQARRWTLRHLAPAPGFAGALACNWEPSRVFEWKWSARRA